jgi:hypothetical protein
MRSGVPRRRLRQILRRPGERACEEIIWISVEL